MSPSEPLHDQQTRARLLGVRWARLQRTRERVLAAEQALREVLYRRLTGATAIDRLLGAVDPAVRGDWRAQAALWRHITADAFRLPRVETVEAFFDGAAQLVRQRAAKRAAAAPPAGGPRAAAHTGRPTAPLPSASRPTAPSRAARAAAPDPWLLAD